MVNFLLNGPWRSLTFLAKVTYGAITKAPEPPAAKQSQSIIDPPPYFTPESYNFFSLCAVLFFTRHVNYMQNGKFLPHLTTTHNGNCSSNDA